EFFSVTAHFIISNFELKEVTLAIKHLPYPHSVGKEILLAKVLIARAKRLISFFTCPKQNERLINVQKQYADAFDELQIEDDAKDDEPKLDILVALLLDLRWKNMLFTTELKKNEAINELCHLYKEENSKHKTTNLSEREFSQKRLRTKLYDKSLFNSYSSDINEVDRYLILQEISKDQNALI
ncbi:9730_t:CDS:2, partial [Cetraspora pellucida]